MIVRCNFEEITAVTWGARSLLGERVGAGSSATPMAAPPAMKGAVESLISHLNGDLSITTLREQRELQTALEGVVAFLRTEMDERVIAGHAAAEEAVSAYFDFAHALSVLGRVRTMGDEMLALADLLSGAPHSEEEILDFVFPD